MDDDSEQPRFVQTVVGPGYQFVASCEEQGGELRFSAEDLGRAVIGAAGLDPKTLKI